ncbi:hypothetical protein M5K25_001886 [Dendrobium thyrsiflorum]|uniref:Uncharacterized protein n=1 Tax=Dendrobium thyrsiflorum TaxID=117978 RepID=A0ABD0W4L5_DENTH
MGEAQSKVHTSAFSPTCTLHYRLMSGQVLDNNGLVIENISGFILKIKAEKPLQTLLFTNPVRQRTFDSFRFLLKLAENRTSFCFHPKPAENRLFSLKWTPPRPSKIRDDARRRWTEPLLGATFMGKDKLSTDGTNHGKKNLVKENGNMGIAKQIRKRVTKLEEEFEEAPDVE